MPTRSEQFKRMLETARDSFEAAQRLIGSGTSIISDRRMAMTMTRGMIDSVLYQSARARRVARDDPPTVNALGVDADQFLAFMNEVAQVRNVAEHWADVINPRKTATHTHVSDAGLKIGVDETSMVVMGPTEIYVGPLNVYDVYLYVTLILEKIEAASPGEHVGPGSRR